MVRHLRSSWAFTAQRAGRTIHEESGAYKKTTSSLTMEVVAVTKAMAWMETQNAENVCILTDSMNMLRKVENGWIRNEWNNSVKNSQIKRITFIYVPGHAGCRGNERADKLAEKASVTQCDGNGMDRADIVNAVKDIFRTEESKEEGNSYSCTRMKMMEVKKGSARLERLCGKQRRLMNQHRTGTISRYSLAEILEWRSEQTWDFPECDEDNLVNN